MSPPLPEPCAQKGVAQKTLSGVEVFEWNTLARARNEMPVQSLLVLKREVPWLADRETRSLNERLR